LRSWIRAISAICRSATQDGTLLGIVASIRDLVKFRFAEQEHDVEALKAYVTRSFMH
jgi:hypothetical protein